MSGLFWRALFAFLVLPGMVAFFIPLSWLTPREGIAVLDARGLLPVAAGTVLLLWCVREFYVAGKGTLAPWAPPQSLVTTGVYRFSRNPMYVAVLLVLCGWAIAFRSPAHGYYAIAVLVLFQLRIVFGEEPWLARTHGDAWLRYKARVSRWVGNKSV